MSRWIKILVLLLGIALHAPSCLAADTTSADGGHREKATLMAHREKTQAVLAGTDTLARICSARPERFSSPAEYQSQLRLQVRFLDLFHHQKSCFCHYRGVGTPLSSRIMAVPPSDYYVVALRHLLC